MEATNEKFPAQWALDLLEPRTEDYRTSIFDYHLAFSGVLTGGFASILKNLVTRKPIWSHLPFTIFAAVCGGIGGQALTFVGKVNRARKDELMRDYIKLHPDRFPEPPNRKYADIFEPWSPVR